MPSRRATDSRLIPITLLVLLVGAYILPGLIGPHLWKPDEPYFFGMVWSLLQGHDWVVPTLAGEPFMEKPPLLMWVAALFAKVFSPILSEHEGARLAIGFFMILIVAVTAQTARRWWGVGAGRVAILSLLTCCGLIQYSHTLLADVPLLAGFVVALYGFSWADDNPVKGGVLLGLGTGMGLLSKGLIAPGAIGVVAVMLPVLFSPWRTRRYLVCLCVAALAALPLVVIWPAALYMRSPALFMEWFWDNNIGRFLGFSVDQLGAAKDPWQWEITLPWFTFPALPMAIATLWQYRRKLRQHTGIQAGLLMTAAILATLFSSASGRTVYALPVLAPLAVLAVPAWRLVPAGLARNIDWLARGIFGAAALFLWVVWCIDFVTGRPPQWAFILKHLPRDYAFASIGWEFFAALSLVVGYGFLCSRLPRLPQRALVSWVAGLALVWGTGMTLWLPWLNASKSYQTVFTQLKSALPSHGCVASHGVGESERAMLDYVADLRTQRIEKKPVLACDYVLIQSVVSIPPQWWWEHGWTTRWEGTRTDERRQRFWLLSRQSAVGASGATGSPQPVPAVPAVTHR
jgi:4-amino-4-deoxy-L-arabinose transferase-like glycosyltransferase